MTTCPGFGMALLAPWALLAACSTVPGGGAAPADEHAGHHPAASEAAAAPDHHAQHMQRMQDLRRKLAEARTPEARAAAMKEHLQAMKDGMAMMGRMHGGQAGDGKPQDADTMKRRMEMMETMMQMMLDRESLKPGATP